jgi:ferredoxin-NADP reductase
MLEELVKPLGNSLLAYVCGPTALVEAVASGLAELGINPGRIRTERFGPTGGT